MGLAVADYDGDSKLDIVKTLFADEMPALYRNNGRGGFSDMSVAAGLHEMTQHIQWGAGLVDFDNDSWPDLFLFRGKPLSPGGAIQPSLSLPRPAVFVQEYARWNFR